MDYKLIGNKVREARLKYGLTQEKLAELVGISDSYMGLIERGERILSVETLVKLSLALGVSTDWLLQATMDSIEKDTFVIQFAQMTSGLDVSQKRMIMDVNRAMLPHFKTET